MSILGLSSAVDVAKVNIGQNMTISCRLVLELSERIEELESLIKSIHSDLLERAEEDSEGFKVVDIGSSIWLRVKDEIKEDK